MESINTPTNDGKNIDIFAGRNSNTKPNNCATV